MPMKVCQYDRKNFASSHKKIQRRLCFLSEKYFAAVIPITKKDQAYAENDSKF